MYTIQMLNGKAASLELLKDALLARIERDGRFRIGSHHIGMTGHGIPTLFFQRIRLVSKKPYCGNHPGPCLVNPLLGPQKKPNATYLEWDDWVAFHGLVNRVCNQRHVNANIWTLPQDARGKFWIRKGTVARVRYDYEEEMRPGRFLPVRVWNTGTPDQFAA